MLILVRGRHLDYLPQAPQNQGTPLHAYKNQRHKTSLLSYDTKKSEIKQACLLCTD